MYKIVDKVASAAATWYTECFFLQVGEGTYGEVYKATPPPEMMIENGELLALKKVRSLT